MLGSVDDDEDDDSDIPDSFKRDTISLLTYLQWAILILILTGLACTLAVAPARRFTLWSLRVWKWEVLTVVLICGSVQGTLRSSLTSKSSEISGVFAKKDGGKQQNKRITIDELRKINQKNVSAWNTERLMRIVRHGALTMLEEQIPQASREESVVTIRSEREEAKIAWKKIFQNVAKPGAK